MSTPHLSPDGSRLVISISDPGDVWIFELEPDLRTRVTFEPVAEYDPIWSPDGKKVAFVSRNRSDRKNIIYARSSFGSGRDELLLESDEFVGPLDWSPDGRFLLYYITDDIHLLDLENGQQTRALLNTPFQEWDARFSPDGRWIAYSSNASGMHGVYVTPFSPDSENENIQTGRSGRWQISTAGGVRPVWGKDGKELYYQAPDKTIMAVEVNGEGDVFASKAAEPLFIPSPTATGYAFDVSNDGQRFIVNTLGESGTPPIQLIVNWTQTLENK